jgi:multicomponent Na+:H+ antiporter subunit E
MFATFVRVLLLALIWAALQGTFALTTVLLGAVFAGGVLGLTQPLFADDVDTPRGIGRTVQVFFTRSAWTVVLLLVFLRELVVSGVQVAGYTLQPSLQVKPGVVAYPLDVQTDREITVLANLISLTPGTLSLDVSPDRAHLYIHAISVESQEGKTVIRDIKGSLEQYVSRALGPRR